MITARTRLVVAAFSIVAVGAVWQFVHWTDQRLGDASVASGWILLGTTVFLLLLSMRKRWYGRGFARVAWWVMLHRNVGWFAGAVFLMHVGWPIYGWFESLLAACFVIVSVTGIVLSILSSRTPRRLTALGEDFRLESIPAARLEVARSAHRIALDSASYEEGATLAEFYQRTLLPYFQHPRGWSFIAYPSGTRRRRLLTELNQLARYLGPRGAAARAELAELVQRCDDLDYHSAMQRRLRAVYWMHMVLTWALAMMIAAHVGLALSFQGGM